MSASGSGGSLDFGDGSPGGILSGTVSFISGGGRLGTLLTGSIFGIIVSIALAGVEVIQAIVDFLTAPLEVGGRAVGTLFQALLGAPANILIETGEQSAQGISTQFPTLAFLVGVLLVLASLYAVNQFLEQRSTGDTFPGLPFDFPFIGVTEEGEEEN